MIKRILCCSLLIVTGGYILAYQATPTDQVFLSGAISSLEKKLENNPQAMGSVMRSIQTLITNNHDDMQKQYRGRQLYEYFQRKEAAQTRQVRLVFGGDIMMSRGVGYYNQRSGWNRMFMTGEYNPVTPYCTGSCLVFFNLEGLFSSTPNDSAAASFSFRVNKKNIGVLQRLRSGHKLILSLANNHSNNGGKAGVAFTTDLLKKNNIIGVGAGLTTAQRNFVTVEESGLKICFGAYSYDTYAYHNKMIAEDIVIDLKKMQQT